MTAITFLDGNGVPRSFEFNEVSGLLRFLIDSNEKITIETLTDATLTTVSSQVYNIGTVKGLSLIVESTGVGTSITFNLQYSNDGGISYTDFFDSNVTWTSNQKETYTLDNMASVITNLSFDLRAITGGTPTITLKMAVIR
jgi:hypothetical protein